MNTLKRAEAIIDLEKVKHNFTVSALLLRYLTKRNTNVYMKHKNKTQNPVW